MYLFCPKTAPHKVEIGKEHSMWGPLIRHPKCPKTAPHKVEIGKEHSIWGPLIRCQWH